MIIRVIRGQNLNRFGTVIRKISQGIGYGTGDAIFDHMAVTAVDNVGRTLTTAYFPTASSVTGDVAAATSPKWTTSQEYRRRKDRSH